MKIFACIRLPDEQLARLRDRASGAEIVAWPDPDATDDNARRAFGDCEIAFGNPPVDWICDSAAMRWIQLESVGLGEYLDLNWPELRRRIQISNLAGFFAEPVAESILAGILALCRGIDQLAMLQRERDWLGEALRPTLRTLAGARVVLVGMGDINRRVHELLQPFACKVTGFRRGWSDSDLDGSLGEADVVICTIPDTPATRGMFDKARLGRIRRGALFANFGRGSLLDEEALADLLEAGHLSGAVIDVTKTEPLPAGHRFWTCPNMLLTQHTGGGTADEAIRKVEFFLANLERYRRGETPVGSVDFARGY